MRAPANRLLLLPTTLLFLASSGLTACDGSGDGGSGQDNGGVAGELSPPDGTWEGDYLSLEINDGKVASVHLNSLSCAQTDPAWPALKLCSSEVADGNISAAIELNSAENAVLDTKEWQLAGTAGPVTSLSAVFTSSGKLGPTLDVVNGVFDFYSEGDCDCHARYTFEAHFQPPEGWIGPDGQLYDPQSEGGGNEGGGGTPPDVFVPEDATEPQIAALNRVNEFREMVGVPVIGMNAALNGMAMNHCACYALHESEYGNMSPHNENAAWGPPCYGDLGARASNANYGGGVGEVMAFYNHPVQAVNGWMATLYHRLPLISPQTSQIGYGHDTACDTINNGYLGSVSPNLEVIYPFDGQTAVDTCWDGLESPTPPSPPQGYPSGPIITLEFSPSTHFNMAGSSITNEETKQELPHYLLVPPSGAHDAGQTDPSLPSEAIALYTHAPMETLSSYRIAVWGTVNGQDWHKEWSFTTNPTKSGCW